MKTVANSMVLVASLLGASSAMAECPLELPYQKLVDCLVTEGAGDEYPAAQVLAEIKAQQEARLQARQEAEAAKSKVITSGQ